MSLLLTKKCDYAILVAIENGQQFKKHSANDIYISCRLKLELPSILGDLIPPNTRLSTKPVRFSNVPEFRTTLVYYVSDRILSLLEKQQAPVTLEVIQLQDDCSNAIIGSLELSLKDAKLVKMRDPGQKMAEIQQFVLDKGTWLPIGTIGQIKTGLFIVKMPSGMRDLGTPLQTPIRTTPPHIESQGLEICSDTSEVFGEVEYIETDYDGEEEDIGEEEEEEEEEGDEKAEGGLVVSLGEGEGQYSFFFRIMAANHISTMLADYTDIEDIIFRYQIAEQEFQCYAEYDIDGIKSVEYHNNLLLQGDLADIKQWLVDETPLRVFIYVKQSNQEEQFVAYASILLKEKEIGVVQQSNIIYDRDNNWFITPEKKFAQLQLQVGLLEGWDEQL